MDVIEANKAIVRRFLQAIASGNVDVIEALQAPECSWWVIGRGDISRETYTSEVKGMLLSAGRRKVEIIRMVAEEDAVATVSTQMNITICLCCGTGGSSTAGNILTPVKSPLFLVRWKGRK